MVVIIRALDSDFTITHPLRGLQMKLFLSGTHKMRNEFIEFPQFSFTTNSIQNVFQV